MADDQNPKFVPAVQNATLILRLLAVRGAPLGATQIARETGLNVSSAFNILRTLAHEGLLSFDPEAKTYRIGMGMMEIAAPLLGANPADLIRPALNEIAAEHQVMIALWQITAGQRIVLIDSFAAARIVQAVIASNSRLPVFAGAIGRCYAAALRLDQAATRAGYDSVRWQSAPGFDAYWNDVTAARDSGTARDRGSLFRGLDMVAALACDAGGTPRLGLSSITITGQHDEVSLALVTTALADTARQIERGIFARTNT
ncbi:IclR family transcriptional regulator [Paracoccus sp. (in: a-proteobacteria)]|uniref:IclR family transcriptional regulator n=1 Tax=Paracoccus sp. TaxID=267 RepID=UPI003A89D226